MSEVDVEIVKKMFPRMSAKNIESNFADIQGEFDRQVNVLAADQKHGQKLTVDEIKQLELFMYATVRAENASFKPKTEVMWYSNSIAFPKITPVYDCHGHIQSIKSTPELVQSSSRYSLLPFGKPFGLYETGKRQVDLANTREGDGERYKGRGYVQLTGRNNYKKYETAVPGLESNPKLAEDSKNAAKLLVAFVLERRNRHLILSSLKAGSLSSARSVVNGKPKHGQQPNGLHEFATAYNIGKDALNEKNAKNKITNKY